MQNIYRSEDFIGSTLNKLLRHFKYKYTSHSRHHRDGNWYATIVIVFTDVLEEADKQRKYAYKVFHIYILEISNFKLCVY